MAQLGQVTALGRQRTQLEKSTRIWQGHSDPIRCRECFSSPRHPYPLAAGSHPRDSPTASCLIPPSIAGFAPTPLQGRAKLGSRGCASLMPDPGVPFPRDRSKHGVRAKLTV